MGRECAGAGTHYQLAGSSAEIRCRRHPGDRPRVARVRYHLGSAGDRSRPGRARTAARVAKQIEQEGIQVALFDRARVEPTDESCAEAARELADLQVDGYVGLGGGSSIDTAKMLNLLLSHPGRRYATT